MRCPSCGLYGGMHYSFCITNQGGPDMGRKNRPNQETRGGDRIDWDGARVGEPLPPRPDEIAETPDEPGVLDYDAHGGVEIDNGPEGGV